MLKRLFALLALSLAAISAVGQTAADKITAGRAALVAHDLQTAQLRFQEALDISPTSQTAGALLGLTRVFAMSGQASSNAFLTNLGMPTSGRDVYNWTANLPENGSGGIVLPANYNLTTVEAFWQGTMIPTMSAARANLAVVTNPGFLVTLSPAETTGPASLSIDYGDVLMARASLSATEFAFQFLSGQDLHANLDALTQLAQGDMFTLQRLLGDNPNFLKLGDVTKRTAAKTALTQLIAVYRDASTFIRNRPAGVTRLFMLDPADLVMEANFRQQLDRLELSLTEAVSTNDQGGAFFSGPLFDGTWVMRDHFPTFTATGFDLESIIDTSLGGLAAGLTREQIASTFDHAELGIDWVSPLPPPLNLNRYLTLANGKRIVAGGDGGVFTSDDGSAWTWRKGALAGLPRVLGLTEGLGKAVAVSGPSAGGPGAVHVSSDSGVTWHKVLEASGTFRGVAFGGGRFLAVGDSGLSAMSTDGESWQVISSGSGTLNLNDVIYVSGSPGYFLAVGNDTSVSKGVVVTLTDGSSWGTAWTNRFTSATASSVFTGAAQNASKIIVVGTKSLKVISASKLVGAAWTEGTMIAATTNSYKAVAFRSAGSLWVAAGDNGLASPNTASVIAVSADEGANWTAVTATGETTPIQNVGVSADGVYFASGNGILLRSTDLTTGASTFARAINPGTTPTMPVAVTTTFNGLRTFNDGNLYALGSGDAIMRSSDGLNFTSVSPTAVATGVTYWDMIRQGATFYAAGTNGTIVSSPDGATWTKLTTNTTSNLRFIGFLNNQYIAAGSTVSGFAIFTSPDGATWTGRSVTPDSPTIFGVAFGNNRYVAVGGNDNTTLTNGVPNTVSFIYVSTDNGVTWVKQTPFTGSTFRGVVFQQGVFTAVGFDGAIFRSVDGVNWEFVPSPAETDLVAIRFMAGRYYALQRPRGSFFNETQSAVLVSSNGVDWTRVELGTSINQFSLQFFGGRLYTTGGIGSILRSEAISSGPVPPVITLLTPSRQVNQGSSIALAASATGGGGLTFQWKKDNVNVPGANTATLALGNVQSGDAGSYTLTVTNAANVATTSTAIVVTVNAAAVAPIFTQQPESQVVPTGGATLLETEAVGTAPISYQWRKDGVDLGGQTGSTLSISNASTANGGIYTLAATNAGGTTVSLPAIVTVDNIPPAYNFTLLAGQPGTFANTDSPARFDNPNGVAVDAAGNIYVSSPQSHNIRKVTPAGVVTTIAGSTSYLSGNVDNATGTSARFNQPRGLAINAAGTFLFVADTANNRIRKVSLTSPFAVTTVNQLTPSVVSTTSPTALALDASENIYYTSFDHTVRSLSANGVTITLLAGSGNTTGTPDGDGTTARFNSPQGIARDGGGNLYVADSGNAAIRKVVPGANAAATTVTTYAGQITNFGAEDGPLGVARFSFPIGIAIDTFGNLFVSDNSSNVIRKISPARIVTTIGGEPYFGGFHDGVGADAQFFGPAGIAVSANTLYLTEGFNHIIRKGVPSGSLIVPIIGLAPVSQSANAGSSVTLRVVATGTSALSFQWRKNGVDLSGQTNPFLTLANVQAADAGNYSVLVSSVSQGSVLSAPAFLTVTIPPTITAQPQTQTVANGQTIALSISATDSGTITYQWRRNGIDIVGADGPGYSLSAARRADAGVYDVVLNGVNGRIVSAPAIVSVAPTSYPGQVAADPAYNPDLLTISTRVYIGMPLPDGKWLAGGEFVRWGTDLRGGLARLNADFSLDSTYTPPVFNGVIHALARDSVSGAIYVGGDFTAVDGHLRSGLARLKPDLSLDLAWKPNDNPPFSQVTALAVQADGKPLVARMSFITGNITGTNVLRRLTTNGDLDSTFSINITLTGSQRLYQLLTGPSLAGDSAAADGTIVLAGTFTTTDGAATRNNLARLKINNAAGTVATIDTAFAAGGSPNNSVFTLTALPGAAGYLVGGQFNSINGNTRNRLAKIDANGALNAFAPPNVTTGTGTNGNVYGATILSNGDILAGGNFTSFSNNTTFGLVRLNSSGAFVRAYTVNGVTASTFGSTTAGRNLTAFTLNSDAVVFFGVFQSMLNQRRVGVAVINDDGSVSSNATTLVYRPAYTNYVSLDRNGELTVLGSIDLAGATTGRNNLVRLNSAGTAVGGFPAGGAGFDPNGLSTFGVSRAVRQGDGKIVAVGDFVGYNGAPASKMVRLNVDGSIDPSFDAAGGPSTVGVQMLALSGGKTLLYNFGNNFNYDGIGVPSNKLLRLNADGSFDDTFNQGTGFLGSITAVVEDPRSPGTLIVAGNFTSYNGVSVAGIAALAPSGALVSGFNPGATTSSPTSGTSPGGSTVTGISILLDGRLIFSGTFTTFAGVAANRLAIFDPQAVVNPVDPSFNAAAAIDGIIGQVLPQEDGKFIVTGEFSTGTAIRLTAAGAVDSSFALRGLVSWPGSSGNALRLVLADDGSLYAHNTLLSLDYGSPRALVRFNAAATAPLITQQPAGGSIAYGQPFVLAVRASGTAPYTYQWRKNGTNITNTNSSVFVIPAVSLGDAGSYDVIVAGAGAPATSTGATLTVLNSVTVADQPASRRVVAGGPVLFRAAATSTINNATFTYQWQKNGANVASNGNAADYVIPNVTGADAASYTVVIGDGANTTTSQAAALTVIPPDPILWQRFTDQSMEQGPGRTIHDGAGKVYLPWTIFERQPDVGAGKYVGALARFNESDGSYDPGFRLDPRYSRASHAVVQPDGKVLVAVTAGNADTVIRVDASGIVDSSFTAPLFARGIRFITRQPDGRVLVVVTDNPMLSAPVGAIGGDVPSLYRLTTSGGLDGTFTRATFSPNASGFNTVFGPPVVDTSGNIYVAGGFGAVSGTNRTNVVRLLPSGAVDNSYAGNMPAGYGGPQARAVALQSDGRAVFVGQFNTNARGNTIMAIRFNLDGSFDSTFAQPLRAELGIDANVSSRVRFMVVLPDDKMIVVSDRAVRLTANGALDPTFPARVFGKEQLWVSRGSDGRYYFPEQTAVSGQTVQRSTLGNGIAVLAANGDVDESFQTGGWGRTGASHRGVVLSDGSVWVSGEFNRFGATYTPGVALFAPNGTLAATQPASVVSLGVGVVADAGNDKVFALLNPAGNSNEATASVFVRLNSAGGVDGGFTPVLPSGYSLRSAHLFAAPSGRVLLAQDGIDPRDALAGTAGNALIRLNSDGTRDTNYNPSAASFAVVERGGNNAVTMIKTGGIGVGQVLPDGKAIVGIVGVDGSLSIRRLLDTGADDTSFVAPSFGTVLPTVGLTPTITDPVTSTTAQFNLTTYDGDLVRAAHQTPAGKVYIGGQFVLGGSPRGLVRLNTNGSLDNTFVGTGIASSRPELIPTVLSITSDASGRVYVAGQFDSFNGTAVPAGVFRLTSDGAFDNAWVSPIRVTNATDGDVRLVVAGDKLYAFGNVALVGDTLPPAYRVADIPPPPTITTAPGTISTALGGSATFTVVAGGTGPFTYQWSKGGTPIGGATNSSFTIDVVSGADAANYSVAVTGPGGTTTTTPVALTVVLPPTITVPPQSQAVSAGQSFSLHVTVTGTAPFTYEWRKGGVAIGGAPNAATYTVNTSQVSDGGSYTVFVSNTAGDALSTGATVSILPAGFSATHAVVGSGYVAGGTVTINSTINYSGTLTALGWQVLLPAGWSYASAGGQQGDVAPAANQTSLLEWAWTSIPASPITFTYTLNVPADNTGLKEIVALMLPRQSGTQYTVLAKPDPLVIDRVTFHTADTNGDSKIALTELLRVIELYNTRNGTVRTGAYEVDATNTEDGFRSAPERANVAATLARNHSADTDHDGRLALTELLRVIELYNYRAGTVRTGDYHVHPGSEDGFNPGPISVHPAQ